jgi:small subunit ribosomal protein S16
VAVRIRLKRLGRRHRPFFRICAMDSRSPRDGKVLEELGTYDPMVRETDARALLNGERIAYWLGVGAQPTDKVGVLIKKYGKEGTHLEKQQAALERVKLSKPQAPPPKPVPIAPKKTAPPPAPEVEASEASEASEEPVAAKSGESPASE